MASQDSLSAHIAVDVETTNHYSRSAWSIGIVPVEPAIESACLHDPVNSEDEFDSIDISIYRSYTGRCKRHLKEAGGRINESLR